MVGGIIARSFVAGVLLLPSFAQTQSAPEAVQPDEAVIPDNSPALPSSAKIVPPVLLGGSECWVRLPVRKGIEVRPTVVRFTVTAEGKVVDLSIVRSSGNPPLDYRALACAARAEYAPAQRDGRPIAVTMIRRFTWKQGG